MFYVLFKYPHPKCGVLVFSGTPPASHLLLPPFPPSFLLLLACFGLASRCSPYDVSGLLSVNALHAFTLGVAQLSLGILYVNRAHLHGSQSAVDERSSEWPSMMIEVSVALSATSFAIAIIAHAAGLQANPQAEEADSTHHRFAEEARRQTEELGHVITARKEEHMHTIWKRFAGAEVKPRLWITPIDGWYSAGRWRQRERQR